MALNYIWIGFFILGIIAGLYRLLVEGDKEVFEKMVTGLFDSAKTGFDISIGLTGLMCFWLGLVKIGEQSGLIGLMSRALSPFLGAFFPEIPKNHPALGQIALNFSANMLGLDNAATPLGLKAMNSLQELNPEKERASNAQIMFLVLNTAGLTLIPVTVFLYRSQAHAVNPTDVYLPLLITTLVGTIAGLLTVSIIQRINFFQLRIIIPLVIFVGLIAWMMAAIGSTSKERLSTISSLAGNGLVLFVVLAFICSGVFKRLNVFETFIDGAKEGFTVAIRIIPYLVAILCAVAVFRASGAMDILLAGLTAFFEMLGIRTDFVPAVPVGIMKSMSGGGAKAMMFDVFENSRYGPDSIPGRIVSIFQGSSDTTFYILAVYFGSVGIKKTRYALACGLWADLVAVVTGIIVAYVFFA